MSNSESEKLLSSKFYENNDDDNKRQRNKFLQEKIINVEDILYELKKALPPLQYEISADSKKTCQNILRKALRKYGYSIEKFAEDYLSFKKSNAYEFLKSTNIKKESLMVIEIIKFLKNKNCKELNNDDIDNYIVIFLHDKYNNIKKALDDFKVLIK